MKVAQLRAAAEEERSRAEAAEQTRRRREVRAAPPAVHTGRCSWRHAGSLPPQEQQRKKEEERRKEEEEKAGSPKKQAPGKGAQQKEQQEGGGEGGEKEDGGKAAASAPLCPGRTPLEEELARSLRPTYVQYTAPGVWEEELHSLVQDTGVLGRCTDPHLPSTACHTHPPSPLCVRVPDGLIGVELKLSQVEQSFQEALLPVEAAPRALTAAEVAGNGTRQLLAQTASARKAEALLSYERVLSARTERLQATQTPVPPSSSRSGALGCWPGGGGRGR